MNITCAMTIVAKPVSTANVRNSASSEAPSTTSGVASGRKTNRSATLRPRNTYRTSASAMNVPSVTAITVVSPAISSEFFIAVARSGSANGSFQCLSVKPSHLKLKRPLLSLNEKAAITKTGMKR